jgi:GAF domain-containing protein
VALRKDDDVLGFIQIYRQEVRPFSDKQVTLLENFAAQAVIAMENARLIAETREALEQRTATAEVLQVINSSPGDLTPVFDAMLEKALRLCEVDIGVLWTYDGEMVHAAAIRGAPPRLAEFLRQGPHRPLKPQQRVLSGERVVQIADVTTSEAYRDGDPIPRATADLGGVRTLLIVPLRKTPPHWVTLPSIVARCGRFRRSRLRCSRPSPIRPSSQWRTRGYSANSGRATRRLPP